MTRGVKEKFPKFLYRSFTTYRNFYSSPSLSKKTPLVPTLQFQQDFHDRKHFWKSFHISVLITFCDTVWICIMLWKCLHLGLNFIFGNRRKSQMAWTGEEGRWGMTVICVEPKNYCTMSDVWAGTLSWCWVQDLLHHLSGSLCWMFWLQRPQTFATEFYNYRLS
jgi:hypothetical protein